MPEIFRLEEMTEYMSDKLNSYLNGFGMNMRKWFVVFSLIILCCMSACSNASVYNEDKEKKLEIAEQVVSVEEEKEVDAINRIIIAEALSVDENSRNVRFILRSLNTIGAGQVQNVEIIEVDGQKVIDLVAEDGTNYQIYLTKSESVEAVKNVATGEWPIQSNR